MIYIIHKYKYILHIFLKYIHCVYLYTAHTHILCKHKLLFLVRLIDLIALEVNIAVYKISLSSNGTETSHCAI